MEQVGQQEKEEIVILISLTRKVRNNIIKAITLLLVVSCNSGVNELEIKKMWFEGDKESILSLVDEISEEEDFTYFLNKIYNVQHGIECVFGYLDVSHNWDTVKPSDKLGIRNNIIIFTRIYVESRSFDCKSLTFDDRMIFQDKYYSREPFNQEVIEQIKYDLNHRCICDSVLIDGG